MRVDRYDAPGFDAVNFVVHDAQGGGIMVSSRLDPAAKSMAQRLLEVPVKIPDWMVRQMSDHDEKRHEEVSS